MTLKPLFGQMANDLLMQLDLVKIGGACSFLSQPRRRHRRYRSLSPTARRGLVVDPVVVQVLVPGGLSPEDRMSFAHLASLGSLRSRCHEAHRRQQKTQTK